MRLLFCLARMCSRIPSAVTIATLLVLLNQSVFAAEPPSNPTVPSTTAADKIPNPVSGAASIVTDPVPFGLSVAIEGGMAVTLVVGLMMIRKSLRLSNWNLAQALSEELRPAPNAPSAQQGTSISLVPSTSRLIALLGTVIIGTFFTGIGFYVVWQLCNGQPIGLANTAWGFFASGATLFLPYGINKFATAL